MTASKLEDQILANPDENSTVKLSTQNPPSSDPLTPTPNSLDVDTRLKSQQDLFMQALREKEQTILSLQREVNEHNTKQNDGNDWARFTEDPRSLIQEEVKKALQPLNEEAAIMRKEREIANIKNAVRGNPAFALVLQKAEAYVDEVLKSANVINVQTVVAAINMVAGLIATGQIQGITLDTTPPASRNQPPKIVPPNLPPSNSDINRLPSVDDKKPWENMTETERRLAREFKMSEEDYWKSMNQPVLTVSGGSKK